MGKKKLDLSKLSSLPEYKHIPRIVRPDELVETPDLVLKIYSILRIKTPTMYNLRVTPENAKRFLLEEIEQGNIESRSGYGFGILSDGNLTVAIWDDKHFVPMLKNQCYTFYQEFGEMKEVTRVEQDYEGFDIWELGIVGHERNAWMEYLISKRTESDKQKYLDNVILGKL